MRANTYATILRISLLLLCVTLSGCAGSNSDTALSPQVETLSGTWDYQVTNAFEASFANCTGDAVTLEGLTFFEGLSAGPICSIPNSFRVVQNGEAIDFLPDTGSCAGEVAAMSGSGAISDNTLSGQWQITSGQGEASHMFVGSASGSFVVIEESHRDFTGTFSGSCDMQPPLSATVTVQRS